MRYLKAKKTQKKSNIMDDSEYIRVASCMINVMYGITVCADGMPLETIGSNYNTYLINYTEYTIFPNIGHVMLLDDVMSGAHLIHVFNRIYDIVKVKHRFISANAATSQYTALSNIDSPTVVLHLNKNAYEKTSIKSSKYLSFINKFEWFIHESVNTMPLYISEVLKPDKLECMSSLSSIIYDNNTFDIDDGYISPDYPKLNQYTKYKSGQIYKHAFTTLAFNIDVEIAMQLTKSAYVKEIITNNITHATVKALIQNYKVPKIFWLDWEHIQPRKINSSRVIEGCILSPKYSRDDIINNRLRCCISDIPIYSDCYVMDIYKISIVSEVAYNTVHCLLDNEELLLSKLLKADKEGTNNQIDIFDYFRTYLDENIVETLKKMDKTDKTDKITTKQIQNDEQSIRYQRQKRREKHIKTKLAEYNFTINSNDIIFKEPMQFLIHPLALKVLVYKHIFSECNYILYRTKSPFSRLDVINMIPKCIEDNDYKNIMLKLNNERVLSIDMPINNIVISSAHNLVRHIVAKTKYTIIATYSA